MSAPNPNLPTNSNPSPSSNSTTPRGDKRKKGEMQAEASTSQEQARKILKTGTGKISKPQGGAPNPRSSPTLNENAQFDEITLRGASDDEDEGGAEEDEGGAENQEGGAANQGEADQAMEEANNEVDNTANDETNNEEEDQEEKESESPMKRANRLSTAQAVRMVDEWVRHGDRRSLDAINRNQKKLGTKLERARKNAKRRIKKNIDGEVDEMVDLHMNDLVAQVNGQLGIAWFEKTDAHNEEVAKKLSKKDEEINQLTIENSGRQEAIDNLTEQKSHLETRVENTMAAIEEKVAELGNATNALHAAAREVVQERARKEEAERRLQETENNLGRIDNDNQQLRDQLNADNIDHQLELEELRQQLRNADLERATTILQLEEKEANLQYANTIIHGHEQRATEMQNTINAQTQASRSKDALLQSAQAEVVATKANLEQLRNSMQENLAAQN